MTHLAISIKGDTGFIDEPLHHVRVDNLHFYAESILGYVQWSKARDAMAGVMDRNGENPSFETAVKAYLDILHEWEYLSMSKPLVILSAVAAWVWVTNSKRHPHD